MALLKRQDLTFEVFDDQSPTLWNSFVGNWTRYSAQNFNNDTVTATPTPGASVSFTFSGTQAWVYGGLLNFTGTNGQTNSYPAADYKIDGVSAGSQEPWLDTSGVVYFQTPKLADGTHEIDITVMTANQTSQYILDFFLVIPIAGGSSSGVETSRSMPSATSSSLPIVTTTNAPVGPIVGGVVGGIAGIAILAFLLWYFLKKRTSGGQAYYFDRPSPADMLASEDHHGHQVEPFGTPATTPASPSARFSVPVRQSMYSDGSSNQQLNPSVRQTLTSTHPSRYSESGPSESGPTYVSGNTAQPRTGKAALIAQRYQNVQEPVQLEDSGIRFNEGREEEPGSSRLPAEVPPSYTAR